MLHNEKRSNLALAVALLSLSMLYGCNQQSGMPGAVPTGNPDSGAVLVRDGNNEHIIYGGDSKDAGDGGQRYYDQEEELLSTEIQTQEVESQTGGGLIRGFDGVSLSWIVDRQGESPKLWNHSDIQPFHDVYLEHDGLYYPVCEPRWGMYAGSIMDYSGNLLPDSTIVFCADDLTFDGASEGFSEYDTDPFVIDVSGGDRIITTGGSTDSMAYALVPVDEEISYTEAHYTNIGDVAKNDEIFDVSLEDISEDYDQKKARSEEVLAQHDISEIEFQLGSTLISENRIEVPVGRYSGAKWEEKTIHIDRPTIFKTAGATANYLDVTKTHDGYFIIELSDVPAGLYVLTGNYGGDVLVRIS